MEASAELRKPEMPLTIDQRPGALARQPQLQKLEVPIPASRFPEAGPPGGETELPLLGACRAWLEAVEKCDSNGPPDDVRDRVIAAGEDSLEIGIELFYPWPTPTREQVAAAIRDLTADDATSRRRAAALLAVRPYPAAYLDDVLAGARGETLRRGLAIRRWRQSGGKILDADRRLRGAFTNWMLLDWPIDQMRAFTIPRLDRLATIEQEEHIWTEKPLYPLLASVRYSPDKQQRDLLVAFAAKARPKAAGVARDLIRNGLRGLSHSGVNQRWGQPAGE